MQFSATLCIFQEADTSSAIDLKFDIIYQCFRMLRYFGVHQFDPQFEFEWQLFLLILTVNKTD